MKMTPRASKTNKTKTKTKPDKTASNGVQGTMTLRSGLKKSSSTRNAKGKEKERKGKGVWKA
jgi:hypothetical protein